MPLSRQRLFVWYFREKLVASAFSIGSEGAHLIVLVRETSIDSSFFMRTLLLCRQEVSFFYRLVLPLLLVSAVVV